MSERNFGVVAVFDTPASLLRACERLRDDGYTRFDAHTPFPIHGIDRAMGLKWTPLPFIVLACALVGGLGALSLQTWVHSVAYPQNIAGKPFFALPAYVPVTFELTILLSAFGTFFGVWLLSGLPRLFHPMMRHRAAFRATDDRFLISVDATDPRFDAARTADLLREAGGADVAEVAS